ncbi:probable aquaporin NIP-type [Cynara cardunculus var. scolymus]|uniref:probable aquaporin NIP-type n=1 Tax=Cynara cardunculus var. scolymus TaxID=59895 RepID=UPI000D627C33|nr:probable aquaporin NIP-type [Cynara cardunculus var. scolymus]
MAMGNDGMEDSNISDVEKGNFVINSDLNASSNPTIEFVQRLLAEFIGTYIIIFIGCGSVVVNKLYDGIVTFPGICVTWGLIVMITIYAIGHVSAHFNPAVTIALTLLGLFPFKEVLLYIMMQLLGSILASATLSLIIDITPKGFFGTTPSGSAMQSLVVEIIVAFVLMFVISGAVNDHRARKELGGVIVGMTIAANVFVGGPISGASMNPVRSLGPAIVRHNYKAIWVYILGPLIGAITGGFTYNLLKPTNKSFNELFKKS